MDNTEDARARDSTTPPWHPAVRVGFRFLFVYMFVELFAPPSMWDIVAPRVAHRLFDLELVWRPNGSGDTTYSYIVTLCTAGFALLGSGLWTVIDRRRQAYPRLGEWLEVVLRYYLASVMLSYGIAKILLSQFPVLDLADMLQTFGEASPMGLVWRFMGYSPAYQFTAGMLEFVGGTLLFWRRTTTLGAALICVVMGNVVLLNFCFDVPVKLASVTFLAIATGLLAKDARRLLAVLVFNKATQPVEYAPHFERRGLHIASRVLKGLVILVAVLPTFYGSASYAYERAHAPRSPLYGIYQLEGWQEDGVERPPLVTDAERWRYLVFERPTYAVAQRMDGEFVHLALTLDEEAGTMVLRELPKQRPDFFYLDPPPEPYPPPPVYDWRYSVNEAGSLHIEGRFGVPEVELLAVPIPLNFELRTRGFNWINEVPRNR